MNDEDVLTIDEHRLHEEWIRQPKLFHEYAEMLANKKAELDTAESRLDVVVADLDRTIRKTPEAFGLTKVTEDGLKNAVRLQPRYQKAKDRVIELTREVGLVDAMVKALSQKKTALESLVYLFGQDYWSEPRYPKGEGGERLREEVVRDIRSRGRK